MNINAFVGIYRANANTSIQIIWTQPELALFHIGSESHQRPQLVICLIDCLSEIGSIRIGIAQSFSVADFQEVWNLTLLHALAIFLDCRFRIGSQT
ncbi:hypothetical protein L6164_020878 [Bauhinia variegata]|uniref:Uncharacterized protein n=1 Tax=Bauhinia variegata TaxID=167791 RepID=A0ACB9MZZ4_BAUVA|nr:hypothetical protein L6164_020878 [Bauhinia variegata]